MRLVYPLLWSRPDRKACKMQTMATVAALARRGVAVTLLMPRGADDPPLGADDLKRHFEVEGEFALAQRPSRWAGEKLGRSLAWLSQVFRDPLLGETDMILSRIPAMLAIGQRAPLPFVTDHYKPWPDALPALRPLFRRTARSRRCLGLILHSDYAAAAYRRIGVPSEKLLVAHNGAAATAGEPLAKAVARAGLGLPGDRKIVLYAGRINARKGLDQLLALADLRPETLFILVGSEGEGPIERAAAGRTNVRIEPWAAPSALPAWLAAADVLAIPPSRAPLELHGDCVLPLKTFAYLAAGRPILAPDSPDTRELLKDGETAMIVPPDQPRAAAAALDRLLGEPALAARLGANARLLSEGLTWDRRAERIESFIEARLRASAQPSARASLVPTAL